jgi:hypothetical protein
MKMCVWYVHQVKNDGSLNEKTRKQWGKIIKMVFERGSEVIKPAAHR